MSDDKIQLNIEGDDRLAKQVEKEWQKKKEGITKPEAEKYTETEPKPEWLEKPAEGQAGRETGSGVSATAPATVSLQQQRAKEIEDIMSDGLEKMYAKLSLEKQREFKLVGEQTARQINELLSQAKVKVNKIIDLIKKWLSIIPGINKFFLEQEAKIKADEIVKLDNPRQGGAGRR